MIKVYALLPKRPDVSGETFHAHWRNPHGELAKHITTLRGYVQSHRAGDGAAGLAPSIYHGIAEVWFDDVETAIGMGTDPNYTEYALLDEPNFIDVPHLSFLLCAEEQPLPGLAMGVDDPEAKVMLLLKRAAGLSREEFTERLAALDGDLAASPGVIRVVRCLALPENYAEGEPLFDGVVELAWPDRAALEQGVAAVAGRLDAVADLSASSAFVSEPYRVIWPVGAPRP